MNKLPKDDFDYSEARMLKIGDVIHCHGTFDYIRAVILLHKKGYELECGETKNSLVITGIPKNTQ